MGLFQRITDVLRSNINDLISRAEDPEKMLNAAIEEMQRQILEAKSRVAMSIADEKRLAKQYDSERNKVEDWEKKAMAAVRANRDDLAREALGRKREHAVASEQYEAQLDNQRIAVDELKRALNALTLKLEETRRKRTLLLARAKRAEAQKHLASTLTATSDNSAAERLERLEARVEQVEAEAEATWEVAALAAGEVQGDLARQIDALGTGTGTMDDELLALKSRMKDLDEIGPGESPKALPAGQPSSGEFSERRPNDELSKEIEELRARIENVDDGEADDAPTEDALPRVDRAPTGDDAPTNEHSPTNDPTNERAGAESLETSDPSAYGSPADEKKA